VPWCRSLADGLSPQRPRFNPKSMHVIFISGRVALGQVFSEYFDFCLSVWFSYTSYRIICHQCYKILSTDSIIE
jgi:hypothetical protein